MDRNDGIIASGGANVVGSAVASGKQSRAVARDITVSQPPEGRQQSPQEIRDLLARLIDELGRSDHPDREGLIDVARDAREELDAPTPRRSKLAVLAGALTRAVAGLTPLAALAVAIEQAIQGL
ncbi:hypothetical protein ACFC1R_10685 [Kitasatospora sp. NPDC056138]|uniref:hypothetical protein n=1 Tax=Kitasatospora sp. NPDC056138 TaxID=3345724 RepID=UPI0035D58171